MLSDFNTGGFTSQLDANATTEIHNDYVKLKHAIYTNVHFQDVIKGLVKRLKEFRHHEVVAKKAQSTYKAESKLITQERFWLRMSKFLKENDIVIAEAGTSLFGTLTMPLPDGSSFIGQPLWGSVGYTVGATLGACIAAPNRQCLLFIGDGSFQLTAQEVSTMIRHQLKPIIFLINNDGYTVERVIHGPTAIYNDIQMWHYAALPKIFGDAVWSATVRDETELEQVLSKMSDHKDELIFIEVVMNKNDSPDILKKVGVACAKQNS